VHGDRATALSDAEILRRTAAGDASAFELLVARHEAAVYRYIRALVQVEDRLDDALQETFIAAWRGAAGFRGESGARAWLLQIARRATLRQYRRHAGEPRHHASLETLAVEAGWSDVSRDPLAERLAARELVEAGFRGLSTEDREILVLRDLEQLTGEEAAATLGITLPAQKSRLHRARLRFLANVKGMDAHDH
jgi:RNA polymerase sigma-70 factor, ECF subfamily